MDIKNKVIFITGGATGIGLATTQRLVAEGARVAIYARTIPQTADIAVLKENPNVIFFEGDIREENMVHAAAQKTKETFGSLDVLINNAAVAQRKPFIETTIEDRDALIDVNIKGTLAVTHAILPIMREQKSGIIINIASGAGLYGIENLSLYSLTKAAIINFTQSLADEVRADNMTVFSIAPGGTDTEMFRACFPGEAAPQTPGQIADVIIKSIAGDITPDDRLVVDVFRHAH
ncbi:MAG: SDR family oxidoreductase [Candidatus Paceibacterota bacterium]|jgi:NAD(P)-dependent dehydrogenase (short-subunit alcohol dehydrogenase family)